MWRFTCGCVSRGALRLPRSSGWSLPPMRCKHHAASSQSTDESAGERSFIYDAGPSVRSRLASPWFAIREYVNDFADEHVVASQRALSTDIYHLRQPLGYPSSSSSLQSSDSSLNSDSSSSPTISHFDYFDALPHIPTTIANARKFSEVADLQVHLNDVLGEAYNDVGGLIEDLELETWENSAQHSFEPSVSTASLPESIDDDAMEPSPCRRLPSNTRRFLSKQMRRRTAINMEALSTVEEPAELQLEVDEPPLRFQPTGARTKQAEEPPESRLVKEGPPLRFQPISARLKKADAGHFRRFVAEKNLNELRKLLNENSWPRVTEKEVVSVIQLFATKGCDSAEARLILSDVPNSFPYLSVPDPGLLSVATRVVADEGIEKAVEFLSKIRKQHFRSSPGGNGAFERRLFVSAVRTASPLTAETIKACSSLADVSIKTHFSANSAIFLQELVTGLLNEKTWEEAFKEWKPLSKRFRQTKGTCELMKAALLSASNPLTIATRIVSVLDACREYENPNQTLTTLLTALIELDLHEDAKGLLTKIAISGRFLKKPIRRWKQADDGLAHLQTFANLIAECVMGEQKRKDKRIALADSAIVEEPSAALPPALLGSILEKYCGFRTPKTKFVLKKVEKKKYQVNESELVELVAAIKRAWISLSQGESKAKEALEQWCRRNKLERPSPDDWEQQLKNGEADAE